MLEQLASEISRKYHIGREEAVSLIENKTLEGLDSLKEQIKI
jgi:hypothetical protein